VLVRLSPTPTRFSGCGVLPLARIELGVRRRPDVAGDAEEGAEGGEWGVPPVEAERELVEVGLKMLLADAMMGAVDPGLQVGKDEMDDRQKDLGHLGIAALGNGEVSVAALPETGVATPVVGDDARARCNRAFDETAEFIFTAVGDNAEPDTPRVTAGLALIEPGARLALADLDCAGNQHFVGDAPAFAARPTPDIGFIDLDVLARLVTNPVLIRTDHAGAQFVQDLERGLMARKPDLTLELGGRHARRLAGDQIGCPEPHAQRRMGALHDRSSRQSNVATALAAPQDPGPIGEAERLSTRVAMWADEPISPPRPLQVGGTSCIVGEQPLELRQRARKRQAVLPRAVHGHPARCRAESSSDTTYRGCG